MIMKKLVWKVLEKTSNVFILQTPRMFSGHSYNEMSKKRRKRWENWSYYGFLKILYFRKPF